MSMSSPDLVLVSHKKHVCTITMNMPKRYNGWTFSMMEALKSALNHAAENSDVKALILTGTDPYYCAGVNLGGTLRLAHPRTLHKMIVEHNQSLFDTFIDFPKPILVAINGPAIGAAVTSATLCDGMIASEQATFSTPFAKLGVAREGCSSVLFAQLIGEENAERMLGDEGWVPNGKEASEIGFVQCCVKHDELLDKAQAIAEEWVMNACFAQVRGTFSRLERPAGHTKM